jgi:uncharacterized protein
MLVKIHRSYRDVVAICDDDLLDKKFEEGERQIDLTGSFFKGEEKNEEEVEEVMRDFNTEDACFYIVGKNSCSIALKIGLVKEGGLIKIDNVPIALALL